MTTTNTTIVINVDVDVHYIQRSKGGWHELSSPGESPTAAIATRGTRFRQQSQQQRRERWTTTHSGGQTTDGGKEKIAVSIDHNDEEEKKNRFIG